MNPFRADLHCHSYFSDGSMSPLELIQEAKSQGLNGLSITDHDTIQAYPEALEIGKELGIQVIPGVEFSTHSQNQNIHILGYAFDYRNEEIKQFCAKHQKRRLDRNLQILDKLRKHGMPVILEGLGEKGTMGRPHIAKALIEQGYVPDFQTAFDKYIGDGKICYVTGERFTIEETLQVIHAAKGLAVLAHPHLYKSSLKHVLKLNFDGIECIYGKLPATSHLTWINRAQAKNLLITGGSDFHGTIKPNIQLGCSSIDWNVFSKLLHHFESL